MAYLLGNMMKMDE